MSLLEQIYDSYPDETFMIADGFDEAIIGIDYESKKIVYSIKKSIELLVNDGMPYEEAVEHFFFNVCGAFVGELTPIWCEDDWENQTGG